MTDANHHAARIAALTRHRGANDPATVEAARELAAAKLEAAIRATVASAPVPTQEQLTRLRALLAAPDGEAVAS
jgi:hypothetical protein